MEKLKELYLKINAKLPVSLLTIFFWVCLMGSIWMGWGLYDQFKFEPDFLQLYGLEPAGVVRARVEEQMRRYRAKPQPPPPPPAQMSYDIRILRQHNPFLPPGMVEQMATDIENKFTDVTGIELIGTVYSYVPTRRSGLIEMNGIALVVMEGKMIRGTQKKVTEIGKSKIVVQEEGLMPSPVYLPHEYGLDDLTRALASNQYRTQPNWEYSARFGKGRKKSVEEKAEESEEGGAEGEEGEKKKSETKPKKKAAAEEDVAAEEEEEEEEEEPAPAAPGGIGGGLDIGGGE